MRPPLAVVSATGHFRHLTAPWWDYSGDRSRRVSVACHSGGDFRLLEWPEHDERPLCQRCVTNVIEDAERFHGWIRERVAELQTNEAPA